MLSNVTFSARLQNQEFLCREVEFNHRDRTAIVELANAKRETISYDDLFIEVKDTQHDATDKHYSPQFA